MAKKYAENGGNEALKLRLEVSDFRKNRDCGIAGLRLGSNISLKSCGIAIAKCFLQVAELRLQTQKNCIRAHL
jgi:hypothetical protein